MFKLPLLLLVTTFLCVNNFYLPANNSIPDKAEEIQNAICTITTKEIEAKANATITRQLKGVCTSYELNLKIDKLQTKLLQEIDSIRYILEINGFKVPNEPSQSKTAPLTEHEDVNDTIPAGNALESPVLVPFLKTNNISPRMEDILMYNNTIKDSNGVSKYFYYWKIEDILELLTKHDQHKSSPDFFVLGHTLHLQFYPNYLSEEHFAIMLKPESSGFIKKHRLVILNQVDPGMDLASGVLYGVKPEEITLIVSEENLRVEGFIVRNTLIVKVEIFL